MAQRYVYRAVSHPPYCTPEETVFTYYSGFSLVQKQRCIASLHAAYAQAYPTHRVLEISTKSTESLGVALSAFNLSLGAPCGRISVECAFQGSKVFEHGGPYTDLLEVSSLTAKRDERLRSSGNVIGFQFGGVDYPTEPKDLFYNWLYLSALLENRDLLDQACAYDAFTDIAFNPARALNCQAKAAAVAVGLVRSGEIEEASQSVESYSRIVYCVDKTEPSNVQMSLFDDR